MIPDIFHFIIPIWLLRKTRRENYSTKPFYRDHKLRRDVIVTFFIITILLLFCSFLWTKKKNQSLKLLSFSQLCMFQVFHFIKIQFFFSSYSGFFMRIALNMWTIIICWMNLISHAYTRDFIISCTHNIHSRNKN